MPQKTDIKQKLDKYWYKDYTFYKWVKRHEKCVELKGERCHSFV